MDSPSLDPELGDQRRHPARQRFVDEALRGEHPFAGARRSPLPSPVAGARQHQLGGAHALAFAQHHQIEAAVPDLDEVRRGATRKSAALTSRAISPPRLTRATLSSMPTWGETRAYVRDHYAIIQDEPNWIGMSWRFRSGDVEVEQRVKVERVFAFEKEWLLIYSAVCESGNVDAVGALRWNALVAIGSLALDGMYCVLRHTLPLATVSFADLDLVIENVAREAARLGRPESPRAPSPIYTPFEK
jgi:hypothetical protein